MATYNVSSGQVVSNTLVYGDVETVSSGGVTQDQYNYGQRFVLSGGIVRNGVVSSGGKDYISSGGSSYQGVISGGGIRYVSGGGTADNTYIRSGGTVSAASGALVLAVNDLSGGVLSAASGAIISGGTVAVGASITADSGAILTGTITNAGSISGGILSGAGTTEIVSSGATLANQTIGSGASATLQAYASAGANLVISGGTLDLYTNNTTSTTIVGTGGNFILESGVTFTATSGNYATSGNTITVNSGAVLSGSRIYSGGVINAQGGVVSSTVVDGGTFNVYTTTSGTNNTTFTSNGGVVNLESGFKDTRTWTVSNNVTFNVLSGAAISTPTIQNGGTVTVVSGGTIAGQAVVSSGGTLIVNGTVGSNSILLSGDGAHLVISGTTMPTNTISGWSPADTIDLASIPAASVTSVTTTSTGITFYTKGGTYSLNVPGASSYGYTLSSDSNGGLIYTTCFAEGTSITTPDGEATVETLVPGTLVMTPKGAMPVKWLGHRSITVSSQPVPEESWLVRIREGALADGVPSRDLLVTQEHCMVFEGKLVPARMLVNGTSILIDRTINSYTYYHMELESHEAVWAENALTESYLDTGNRNQFDNHTVTAIFGGSKAGGSKTLPLETSRAFVEPIYAGIAARAGSATRQVELTNDPDLHLVTNFGQVIRPLRQANERVMFMIPANVATVRVVSRTSRPSDVIGPFVDDRRDLGVLVGDISLFAARQTVNLTAHLSVADLSGWHALESSAYRWTEGNAALPLQSGGVFFRESSVLSIQVVSSGPYLTEDQSSHADLRQAG
uniref:Hint domain-containing protein n=1 Tax=Gluconobacter thailandicus TaxID=257438 RepID=UPI000A5D0727|nr:Hint domain-containing protein [Gluconobacter thailandicus]